MARVTATEVKAIMDNCILSDTVVGTFILASNKLVTKVFEESTLDADILKEIERYLTAHIIASTKDRMTSEEKLGDASVKYTGKWGEGLKSTSYGQMALLLDVEGLLLRLGKIAASIYAVESFD
jgi:hypothetical protein